MTNEISQFTEPVDSSLAGKVIVPLISEVEIQNPVLKNVVRRMQEIQDLNESGKRQPSYYNNGSPASAAGW